MTRIEHDSMGEVEVPDLAKWRAQTAARGGELPRAPAGGWKPAHISALGTVKAAAAVVNASCGLLEADMAAVIAEAAGEVAANRWDEHFPVDVFQTGFRHRRPT